MANIMKTKNGKTTIKLKSEDTAIVFDGNAQDYRIGIDDGTDGVDDRFQSIVMIGSARGTEQRAMLNKFSNYEEQIAGSGSPIGHLTWSSFYAVDGAGDPERNLRNEDFHFVLGEDEYSTISENTTLLMMTDTYDSSDPNDSDEDTFSSEFIFFPESSDDLNSRSFYNIFYDTVGLGEAPDLDSVLYI